MYNEQRPQGINKPYVNKYQRQISLLPNDTLEGSLLTEPNLLEATQ